MQTPYLEHLEDESCWCGPLVVYSSPNGDVLVHQDPNGTVPPPEVIDEAIRQVETGDESPVE